MKYGLFDYPEFNGFFNVGDYIQSIAARQFLPNVDAFVNKEDLRGYSGDPIKLIMNGWYMRQVENWPPSSAIKPLFVSMHINSNHIDGFSSDESLAYFKQYEPIGCRDEYTKKMLEDRGIAAYFSGCLTLTLGRTYKKETQTNEIVFVDPVAKLPKAQFGFVIKMALIGLLRFSTRRKFRENFLKFNRNYFDFKRLKGRVKMFFQVGVLYELFEEEMLIKGEYVHHSISEHDFPNAEMRFAYAEKLLHKYANAKTVITSRIHCGLPSLAIGTPVIFLNVGYDNVSDHGRTGSFKGLFNYVSFGWRKKISNFINLDTDKIGLSTEINNPDNYRGFVEGLNNSCEAFIKG